MCDCTLSCPWTGALVLLWTYIVCLILFNPTKYMGMLPWQVVPFPLNPSLQEQVYPPVVLVQSACASHGFVVQSLTSPGITKYRIILVYQLSGLKILLPLQWYHHIKVFGGSVAGCGFMLTPLSLVFHARNSGKFFRQEVRLLKPWKKPGCPMHAEFQNS